MYTFNLPAACPRGANFIVMVKPNAGATTNAFYACTVEVENSTSLSAWCRKADNALKDGDFYVYSYGSIICVPLIGSNSMSITGNYNHLLTNCARGAS